MTIFNLLWKISSGIPEPYPVTLFDSALQKLAINIADEVVFPIPTSPVQSVLDPPATNLSAL